MKIGGADLRSALGMLSSPGDVKGSRAWMIELSSWRVKGESREDEIEEEGGSRLKSGGGRSERRLSIWEEKDWTVEVMSEGDGIGVRLSQLV
jgi:hypothetical protein